MIFYLKLGKVRGISIELNKTFGIKPVYKITNHHCETVVDVPYIQCIYTSGQWSPKDKLNKDVANDDTRTSKKAKEI